TVQLPSILDYYKQSDKYNLADCILTAPPQINTSNSNSSSSSNGDKDSMVYILFDGCYSGMARIDLLFCHPGEKEWRRYKLDPLFGPTWMFYIKNKLHIMCFNPVYYEIEVKGGSDVDETLTVGDEVIISTDNIIYTESSCGSMLTTFMQYYVESFGEVFRI
ncbi:hypothetical protein MKW94_013905, partial [Papaver nudicaule]|nr:hypothetical protein [Papaver nudicaule]